MPRPVRRPSILPLLASLVLLCASGAAAQEGAADAGPLREVRLQDGSVLYGRVLEEGPPLRLLMEGATSSRSMVESYAFDGDVLAIAGVGFFGERLSADLGVGTLLTGDAGGFLPVVNFVYTW